MLAYIKKMYPFEEELKEFGIKRKLFPVLTSRMNKSVESVYREIKLRFMINV